MPPEWRLGDSSPSVVIIAGPNGAGKSTVAPHLLRGTLGVLHFVNADTIVAGLSGYAPETAALQAGRIMLERMRQLASERVSFAFETMLASRSIAVWLRDELHPAGYKSHLLFLWLESANTAIQRVAERVRAGGHDVPERTIERRFQRGIANFERLYRGIVHSWRVYNATLNRAMPTLIASGGPARPLRVRDGAAWKHVQESLGHE